MTTEEAYELVTEALKTWKIPERAHDYDLWEIVQNSLEKQIPKKIEIIKKDDDNKGAYCGCGQAIDWTYNGIWMRGKSHRFCLGCGQAIAWEGVEE